MLQNPRFTIARIGPDGSITDFTISAKAAAKNDPEGFLKLYRDIKAEAEKLGQLGLFDDNYLRNR